MLKYYDIFTCSEEDLYYEVGAAVVSNDAEVNLFVTQNVDMMAELDIITFTTEEYLD